MLTLLKSTPKLLGAKGKIKFLYIDLNVDKTETASYDQAIIEKISIKSEIKALDFTLSQCVIGIKCVPGNHHYAHVLMVEHLCVIKEGHSDVEWEPKPKLTPRQEILERLRTLSKSQHQSQSDDDDDDWDVPPTPRQRLSAQLKRNPTPDPSPSPPTERHYSQHLANLASARPKVVASTPATKSRFLKPTTVHKITKAFGSEQLNILPFSY